MGRYIRIPGGHGTPESLIHEAAVLLRLFFIILYLPCSDTNILVKCAYEKTTKRDQIRGRGARYVPLRTGSRRGNVCALEQAK